MKLTNPQDALKLKKGRLAVCFTDFMNASIDFNEDQVLEAAQYLLKHATEQPEVYLQSDVMVAAGNLGYGLGRSYVA